MKVQCQNWFVNNKNLTIIVIKNDNFINFGQKVNHDNSIRYKK